jgi:hypothetical protein
MQEPQRYRAVAVDISSTYAHDHTEISVLRRFWNALFQLMKE